jgi:hypothetical protein
MAKLLVFCEAPADSRTVKGLVDRVLTEEGPRWLRDILEGPKDAALAMRDWEPDGEGRDYFDVHQLPRYTRRLGIRAPPGHFNGEAGAAGALMARTAFKIAHELVQTGTQIDAVLLVWDMDDQGDDRRQGMDQARNEACHWAPFAIVLGRPNRMCEAWVLAGFEPETDDERASLASLRQELGFHPCEDPHRLDAKDEHAKKSPKRVLDLLTKKDHDRKTSCWTAVPLATLRARGKDSGLTAFLDEAAALLVPLVSGVPAAPPAKQ